jgi:hypothetical protein
MLVFAVAVRRSRANCSSDDDGVHIGGHRMFHFCGDEQEAANWISRHMP